MEKLQCQDSRHPWLLLGRALNLEISQDKVSSNYRVLGGEVYLDKRPTVGTCRAGGCGSTRKHRKATATPACCIVVGSHPAKGKYLVVSSDTKADVVIELWEFVLPQPVCKLNL